MVTFGDKEITKKNFYAGGNNKSKSLHIHVQKLLENIKLFRL